MSTAIQQYLTPGVLARYEDAKRRIGAGASQRQACAAAGITRGAYHRAALSLRAGARVLPPAGLPEWRSAVGRWAMFRRWMGHTPVSRGSPEIERAYQRAYRRERMASDPGYRLYRLLLMRFWQRRRRDPGYLAGAGGPRMRNKRLVLNADLLPLLTDEERRALFPAKGVAK